MLARHVVVDYVPERIHTPELGSLSEAQDGLVAQLRSTSISLQSAMMRAGIGVGILPGFIGANPDFIGANEEKLVAVLTQIELRRRFWLVTHSDDDAAPHSGRERVAPRGQRSNRLTDPRGPVSRLSRFVRRMRTARPDSWDIRCP